MRNESMKKKLIFLLLLMIFLTSCEKDQSKFFDGESAFNYAKIQVDLGPRTPGSEAHAQTIDLIIDELKSFGWSVDLQNDSVNGFEIQNIIGKYPSSVEAPWIIIGAHYDSRFFADNDAQSQNHLTPVVGANDGASGVAVLLELARVLPEDINKNIWFVFFDTEDQGNIEGWDWILGSRSFVNTLQSRPDAVVILDMIGDEDLNIHFERNSDIELQKEIWDIAASLGYEEFFIPEYKYSILDDHIPFIEKGIKAIDVIDFDYPYWHTTQDTIDKISPESLEVVGSTIYHWLLVP